MAMETTSPFCPGRPVPVGLFVGRAAASERLRRKAASALAGRVEVGFVAGERGIGKSSLASFVLASCESDLGLLGLHTFLGNVSSLDEMVRRVFDQLVKEGSGPSWSEKVKDFLGGQVAEVGLFGFSLELGGSDKGLRRLVHDFAPALRKLLEKLHGDKRGILLVLDDIGRLARCEEFAHWLKSLVDGISVARRPLPLCLLLVGLEEHRRSLVGLEPSLARVFEPVDVGPWGEAETRQFFNLAFTKASLSISDAARLLLARCTGGLPFLGHELGELAFQASQGKHVDIKDAGQAVTAAAELVGRKYLPPEVCGAVRRPRYRGVLQKVVGEELGEAFVRDDIAKHLAPEETGVLDELLGELGALGVLAQQPERGPHGYTFASDLHYLYFQLEAEGAKRTRG